MTLALQESISGVIRDGSGNPIAGAGVQLISTSNRQQRLVAVSGADGRYTIKSIANDTYDLVVIVRDFASSVLENVSLSGGDVNIALSVATSQLTGRLVDSTGSPVPHGAVEVRDAQGRKIGEAIVNTAGEFQVKGAVGTDLRVAVQTLGFAALELTTTVAPGGAVSLGNVVTTAIAIGQGYGTQPIPQPPLPGALDDPSGGGGALPAWLGGNFFNTLFGEFQRNLAAEVAVDSIPDLPQGCTECGPSLHQVLSSRASREFAPRSPSSSIAIFPRKRCSSPRCFSRSWP